MSEEDIQEFIAITAASRRSAIWFITHNPDLNEAVDNFFVRGESSIPDDFDPDHGSSDSSTESSDEGEEEEVHESAESLISSIIRQINDMKDEEEVKPEEEKSKGISTSTEDTFAENDENLSIKEKPKFKEGTQASFVLVPNEPKKEEIKIDKIKGKKARFQQRDDYNIYMNKPFIIWKNGYSVGSFFYEKTDDEMKDVLQKISVGQVPCEVSDTNDIQLVDKSQDTYDPSFNADKVLALD